MRESEEIIRGTKRRNEVRLREYLEKDEVRVDVGTEEGKRVRRCCQTKGDDGKDR